MIDHVILGIKFENDLTRGEYSIVQERMRLESPIYRAMRQIKLLVYLQTIGAFDAPRDLMRKLLSRGNDNGVIISKQEEIRLQKELETKYIKNFKKLVRIFFGKRVYYFLGRLNFVKIEKKIKHSQINP